mgnify:CR=1 FL=1
MNTKITTIDQHLGQPTPDWRRCPCCGAEFAPQWKWQQFCSTPCRIIRRRVDGAVGTKGERP